MSLDTSSSSVVDNKFFHLSWIEAFFKISFTSSFDVFLFDKNVISKMEPEGTGTLRDIPSNLPCKFYKPE
jgi:hypothetical protein